MARLAALLCAAMLAAACAADLSVDPALADSMEKIGQATTGQLELTQQDWVDIGKEACEQRAHLDPSEAERIALDRGVVFIGTGEPVIETVQVLGEAVCSVNGEA